MTGSLEVMVGKIEERSIRTLEMLERMETSMNAKFLAMDMKFADMDKRLSKLEQKECGKHNDVVEKIHVLEVNQEKLRGESNVEDQKLYGLVTANTVRTTSLSATVVFILQWVFSYFKGT